MEEIKSTVMNRSSSSMRGDINGVATNNGRYHPVSNGGSIFATQQPSRANFSQHTTVPAGWGSGSASASFLDESASAGASRAGVGLHITLQSGRGEVSKVVVTALTPWSPLKGHVEDGDILTAIDGLKLLSVPFEQVDMGAHPSLTSLHAVLMSDV